MDEIANGRISRETVVGHSRELLGKIMDDLIPQAAELGETLKTATAADAKVGVCKKSGHDLLVKSSAKTRGQFVGCSGWPECDVTYPLPQGKIEAVDEACPECGTPQVKVIQFRTKPRVMCLDPNCPTNHEPEVVIGTCAKCAEEGRSGELKVLRSARTLKRFVRCTNYDVCGVSYPLPQRGTIEPTGETCVACAAPEIVVQTGRGPWRICIDPNCPAKAEAAAKKAAPKKPAPKRKPAAKSATTKKSTATKKKPAAE
jgi:DNA topoisomerase-1